MRQIFQRLKLARNTGQIKKENLILVNSFGTNSHVLKPAIQYFEDYFNVYFIDLPGFINEVPPLHSITINEYTAFVESKIKELQISEYILGGISFGFFIASHVVLDKRCKALFAMEPYIGIESLRLDKMHTTIYIDLLTIITKLHLVQPLWKNKYFPKLLELTTSLTPHQIRDALNDVDAKTFVETAKLLLLEHDRMEFKHIPYILGINRNDETINATYVVEEFNKFVKELFIIDMHVEHYPKNLTVDYLKRRIAEKDMFAMLRWLKKKEKQQKILQ